MTGDQDEEEFRRDVRVVLAARAMDPALGRAALSPELSPSAIIELAGRGRSAQTRERVLFRRPAVLTLAVLVAAIVVIPVLALRVTSDDPLTAGSEVPPVSFYLGDGTEAPGGPRLRGVADAAARSVPSVPGPVTYVRVRTWSLDTKAGRPSATTLDKQLWWTADRAGLLVVTTVEGWRASATVMTGPIRAPHTTVYAPHKLDVVVERPSPDPALLAAQLNDHEPLINGPQAVLRGVRDLYRYHALDGLGRSAALRVLAETPGIVVRGTVTLESGLSGLVVSADSSEGTVRDLAVFDPADGRLLAYQQVSTRSPRSSAGGQPQVTYMMVVLISGTTESLGSPDARTS